MPLRSRLTLFLALIALLPLSLFGFTAYRVSTNNLIDVEKDNLDQALTSVKLGFDNLQSNQAKFTTDWSNFDDLHSQVAQETLDPDWIKTNLDPATPNSAGNTYNLALIGVWNDGLQPLYSYGLTEDAAKILDATMSQAVLQDKPTTQLILIGEDVYYVSVASIRTSSGDSPNGVLMFGNKIGSGDIGRIRDLTGYDVALYRGLTPIASTTNMATLTPDADGLRSAASGQIFFQQSDNNVALAFKPLQDFTGNNIATIVVSRSRTATIAAQNSITSVLAIFFLLGLLLAALFSYILNQTILPPLFTIIGAATKFAEGDLKQRVEIKSRDELGQLAKAFNVMADKVASRVTTSEGENTRLQEVDAYRLNLITEITAALRTPLKTIKTGTETLERLQYGPLNEPQERLVSGLRRSVTQSEALLADLLDFSRAQQKQLQIVRERLVLDDIVRDTSNIVKDRFKTKQVQFSTSIPKDLPLVLADRTRMEQVLDSLLTFTFDYSISGGQVKLLAYAMQERNIQITISDTSSGLSSDERTKLFDLFYHPKDNGLGVNGLGLAFVKALIEQQGGTIAVESEPGQGNIFTISMPTV